MWNVTEMCKVIVFWSTSVESGHSVLLIKSTWVPSVWVTYLIGLHLWITLKINDVIYVKFSVTIPSSGIGAPQALISLFGVTLVAIIGTTILVPYPLQWRHYGRDGNCLLNRLFRRRSKKTSKLRFTGLCEGNSPVTGEFPAQRASNAENVSIIFKSM